MNDLYGRPRFRIKQIDEAIVKAIESLGPSDYPRIQAYSNYLSYRDLQSRRLRWVYMNNNHYSSSYCNVIGPGLLGAINADDTTQIYTCIYYLKEMDLISSDEPII